MLVCNTVYTDALKYYVKGYYVKHIMSA